MSSEAARAALAQRKWREARDLLAPLAERGEADAADLDALADAAHAVGDHELAVHSAEEAHAAYVAAGDAAGAAATAIRLANIHLRRRELAVCAGWTATAERLLADEPEGAAHGLVAWMKATYALVARRDLDTADQLTADAARIGERCGGDVQALALVLRAELTARRGDAGTALELVDAAMTPAVGGQLSPWAACHVLCRSMVVCQDTGDVRRGREWAAAARAAAEREGSVPLRGDCRVHHACLLNQQGEWVEAEQEARAGCDELPDDVVHRAIATYELGELALRRGDFAGAEASFLRANELGLSPQPGLALLRHAQGDAGAAAATIAAALDDETFAFRRALLLAAQAEVALDAGDRETARRATGELQALDKALAAESVAAFAETAAGALALAESDAGAARTALRSGARRWARLGIPYQAARARRLLADAYAAAGDPDSAELELRAVRAVYEELGAQPDARDARAALRRLGRDDAAAPEHVTRAFMFTDIVGSTALVQALGDDAWADLLHWHDATLRGEFAAYRGQEVDKAGDGFFVAFATADDALACAAGIQRRLRDHRREHGFAPRVRIGVHVGDASADGDDYVGLGVHAAARIGAEADAGEILASRAAVAAAAAVETGEPRTVTLRGLGEPLELVPVVWD